MNTSFSVRKILFSWVFDKTNLALCSVGSVRSSVRGCFLVLRNLRSRYSSVIWVVTPIRFNTSFTSFVVRTKFSALNLSGSSGIPCIRMLFSDIVIQVRWLFGVCFRCSTYISRLDGNILRIALTTSSHPVLMSLSTLVSKIAVILFSIVCNFFVDLLRFFFNPFILSIVRHCMKLSLSLLFRHFTQRSIAS